MKMRQTIPPRNGKRYYYKNRKKEKLMTNKYVKDALPKELSKKVKLKSSEIGFYTHQLIMLNKILQFQKVK